MCTVNIVFSQAFEDEMKQKQEQLQKLREKLLHLIEDHPNSPEAAKWKQMLAQIGTHQGCVSRWSWVVYDSETVRVTLNPTGANMCHTTARGYE